MFSTFIRLGAALSCAAMLCSCGGNSVAETQQSTPEGLYTGQYDVQLVNPNVIDPTTGKPLVETDPCTGGTENVITFAVATGSIYTFYPSANDPSVLNAADNGSLTFSLGSMSSALLEVIAPASVPSNAAQYPNIASRFSALCDYFPNNVAAANMTGGYNTGVNLAMVLTFSNADSYGWFNTTQTAKATLLYDADYQGIQSLSTLAGTYNGIVSTSSTSESATFTIGPAGVPANAGNDLGVSVLTGTGASGCSYTGSVSPLFKGNGYSITMTSGAAPCALPQTQFEGLIYLNTQVTPNILYSFSPDTGHSDGVIFSGTRVGS